MAKKSSRISEDLIPFFKALVWVVGIVIALVIFYGFLFLIVGLKNFVPLINGLAWPTVVVIVLIVFRKPLADFLRGITGRVTKFSITQIFSVELSLPEASEPKLDPALPELEDFASGLASAVIVSTDARSALLELLDQKDGKALDYIIVDLGEGKQWLTSRLFIFTLMLERMRGLKCLVFLSTRNSIPQSFLGTALPHEVRWALARRYGWLDEAYVKAQLELYKIYISPQPVLILSEPGVLQSQAASLLINSFLTPIQDREKKEDTPPDPSGEWIFLKKGSYWERADWIDAAHLKDKYLGDALQESEYFWYKDKDPLDTSPIKRVQALLRRKGSIFVALVDERGVFKGLIDRKALLEQVAERLGAVSDDKLPTE